MSRIYEHPGSELGGAVTFPVHDQPARTLWKVTLPSGVTVTAVAEGPPTRSPLTSRSIPMTSPWDASPWGDFDDSV